MENTTAIETQLQELHRIGIAMHLLKARSKSPLESGWRKQAHSLEKVLQGIESGHNVAFQLGAASKTRWGYLHALDADLRDLTKQGDLEAPLAAALPESARRFVANTGSGTGQHYFFFAPEPLPSHKLAGGNGWELALKGSGTYVVAPGSIHPSGGRYAWQRGKRLDPALLELVTPPRVALGPLRKAERPAALPSDPLPRDELEAALEHLDPSELGYDEWCNAGMALHHESGGADWAFDLFDTWSQRDPRSKSDGGYPGKREMRTKWRSFGKWRGGAAITGATLLSMAREVQRSEFIEQWLAELEDLPPRDFHSDLIGKTSDDWPDLIAESEAHQEAVDAADLALLEGDGLNDRYALVRMGKDVMIADLGDPRGLSFLTLRGFRELYAHGATGDRWTKDPDRRTYGGGLTFAPDGKHRPDQLNLWQGWGIKPNPDADCSLILWHIREVLAAGISEHGDYIISWLADLVQNPARKPGVAIVLHGKKGAGKDTLVEAMRPILGNRHVALANSPERLTGRFNSLYEQALLVHAEEASWGGDKAAKGVLQSLITNETIVLERKGVDAVMLPSHHRVIFSTNEQWAVPATADERRYAVFDVDDSRVGDREYFDALYREIRGDGPAGLLAFLLAWNAPNGIEVRNAPQTQGLLNQKLAGIKNVEAWWLDTLQSASLGQFELEDSSWQDAFIQIDRSALHSDYRHWMEHRRFHGDVMEQAQFGRNLHELCPQIGHKRLRRAGERVRSYSIPPLGECREAFARYMRCDVSDLDWES